MKQFLAVYMGSASESAMTRWKTLDNKTKEEREKIGIAAWISWGERFKDSIVENGAPLGKTKLVNASGITDTKNLMAGYTIVRAESHEAAAKMFVEHPHFSLFPGESVEIMECLPLPAMG